MIIKYACSINVKPAILWLKILFSEAQHFTYAQISNHLTCKVWDEIIDLFHYNDVIMATMASQITSLMIVFSTVYSDADKKNQNSASLAFVLGIR